MADLCLTLLQRLRCQWQVTQLSPCWEIRLGIQDIHQGGGRFQILYKCRRFTQKGLYVIFVVILIIISGWSLAASAHWGGSPGAASYLRPADFPDGRGGVPSFPAVQIQDYGLEGPNHTWFEQRTCLFFQSMGPKRNPNMYAGEMLLTDPLFSVDWI